MKKTAVSILIAFASVAFAKPETPREKSLALITDKTMSLVMLVEARLKNLLAEVKTNTLSDNETSENWDKIILIKILYKERKLDIFKAYYQHYRTFGRGNLMSKEEVRLNRMTKEHMARAEEFWSDVKMVKSNMRIMRWVEPDFIEPLTELGPSLAKQVIKESDRLDHDEVID